MFKDLDIFCDYLEHEKRYSVHTINAYKKDITQFLLFCQAMYEITEISSIKHYQIRSWLVQMVEDGKTAKSLNRKISSLRSFFKHLRRQGTIDKNPTTKIVAPKIPKRLPEYVRQESLEKLFQLEGALDFAAIRDNLCLKLLYETGMRRSELIGLKLKDVLHSDNLIKVLGKGNKERLIPVSGDLLNSIKEYNTLKQDTFDSANEEYLLLTDKGKKMYPKFVYNLVNRRLSLITANKKKSPHILRHSFATHLTNNGADINAIKELLGHANLGATQIYTHNSIAKLKEVYQKAHPKAKR